MSIDKFTSRGFGGSGSSASVWNGVRHGSRSGNSHYTAPSTGGASHQGGFESSLDRRGGSLSAQARGAARDGDRSSLLRSIPNVRGGDSTTTKWQRRGLLLAALLVTTLISLIARGCESQSSARTWINERRLHLTQGAR